MQINKELESGEKIVWQYIGEKSSHPIRIILMILLTALALFLLWTVIICNSVPSGIILILQALAFTGLLVSLALLYWTYSGYRSAQKRSRHHYYITNKRVIIYLNENYLNFSIDKIKSTLLKENEDEDETITIVLEVEDKIFLLKNLPEEEAQAALKCIVD